MDILDNSPAHSPQPARTKQVSTGAEVGTAKRSYIYVIRCGRFFKVGSAVNVESRLRGLQIGNPHPLKVVHAVAVPAHEALDIERTVHKALRAHRINGEWFRLRLSSIKVALEIVLQRAPTEPPGTAPMRPPGPQPGDSPIKRAVATVRLQAFEKAQAARAAEANRAGLQTMQLRNGLSGNGTIHKAIQ